MAEHLDAEYYDDPADFAGFTYAADVWCPACIRTVAARRSEANGKAADYVPLKRLLERWADELGITDPQDEYSYDSGDFPKPISEDGLHDTCRFSEGFGPGQCNDQCAGCGEHLGVDCPNTETDPQGLVINYDGYDEHSSDVVRAFTESGELVAELARHDAGYWINTADDDTPERLLFVDVAAALKHLA